jgi:hypothetical protein
MFIEKIYELQHLDGSVTPVLYIGHTIRKGQVIIVWKLRRIEDQASLLKYSTILTFIRAVPLSKFGRIPIIMVEAFVPLYVPATNTKNLPRIMARALPSPCC